MSTDQSKPVKIAPTKTKHFKTFCIACFFVARSIPRVLDEIPKHLRDLASEVSDAWKESAKR